MSDAFFSERMFAAPSQPVKRGTLARVVDIPAVLAVWAISSVVVIGSLLAIGFCFIAGD